MSEQQGYQKGDFGSMVWVRDSEGHEFACTLDHYRKNVNDLEELTEHERESCQNVNQIVGTERW